MVLSGKREGEKEEKGDKGERERESLSRRGKSGRFDDVTSPSSRFEQSELIEKKKIEGRMIAERSGFRNFAEFPHRFPV